MKDASLILRVIGDNPRLRVIDFFVDNMPFDYSKKEIIEGSEMSKTTFFKIWNDLMKFGIVTPTRKYGKTQLFSLNEGNEIVKKLLELEYVLVENSSKKFMKKIPVAVKR